MNMLTRRGCLQALGAAVAAAVPTLPQAAQHRMHPVVARQLAIVWQALQLAAEMLDTMLLHEDRFTKQLDGLDLEDLAEAVRMQADYLLIVAPGSNRLPTQSTVDAIRHHKPVNHRNCPGIEQHVLALGLADCNIRKLLAWYEDEDRQRDSYYRLACGLCVVCGSIGLDSLTFDAWTICELMDAA